MYVFVDRRKSDVFSGTKRGMTIILSSPGTLAERYLWRTAKANVVNHLHEWSTARGHKPVGASYWDMNSIYLHDLFTKHKQRSAEKCTGLENIFNLPSFIII